MAEIALRGVGILPAGALGMSFFYHLTRQLTQIDGHVYFLERKGSESAKALRANGEFRIADKDCIHHLDVEGLFEGDLQTCFVAGWLPEILLVCTNPDQLNDIIASLVELLECMHQAGRLSEKTITLPTFVLCSNGIYFQRLRSIFLEKLEESVLFGRLPDLWPELMPQIVARMLRGITLQTGVREGSGEATLYRPGPCGITHIAGGTPDIRQHCCQILAELGGWFEQAVNDSATHLEFDKAMVNLSTNLLGQIHGINDKGFFSPLTIREMLQGPLAEEIRELCAWVFRIGQAVNAYEADDDFEERLQTCLETLRMHQTHIPSSVQWVGLHYQSGTLQAKLTPTEAWLLGPLIRYARGANLEDAAVYLEGLKSRLLDKLSKAAKRQHQSIDTI